MRISKIFLLMLLSLVLALSLAGCDDESEEGKTVIIDNGYWEAYVDVDVFSLKAGAHDAFFVNYQYGETEKFPCRILVSEKIPEKNESVETAEAEKNTFIVEVYLPYGYHYGNYIFVYSSSTNKWIERSALD